jgi:hypothetical protein
MSALITGLLIVAATPAFASSTEHSPGGGDHGGPSSESHVPHFSPPLTGKNPSPVSELRLDHFHKELRHNEGQEQTFRLVGEYAFAPSFSVELGIPYTIVELEGHDLERNLDTVFFGAKYANFAFADKGIVLGGGVEIGFATGDHHKHIGTEEEVLVEPYLQAGWKGHALELTSSVTFGVPIGIEPGLDLPDLELLTSASILYNLTPRIRPFVEFYVEKIYGGDAHPGRLTADITPGIKVKPWGNFELGLGFSIPISKEKEYDWKSVASLFYHF